jgi:micrococcal nuclease
LRIFCQNFVLVSALTFLLAPTSALPASAEELRLVKGEIAEIAMIVDGDTVKLTRPIGKGNMISDQIRLVGIQAPKLPLGRKNFKIWPLAKEAKAALRKLSLDKKVQLSYGGRRMDRHGRLLAHLHLLDGTWLQGRLLADGMARVYSFPDNRAVVTEMLAKEKIARARKKGIWQNPFYRIRRQDELAQFKNSFQLVEAKILDVAKVRKRIFINFGPNWRTDFTVSLNARAVRLFKKAAFDVSRLKGKRVRVRGWIKSFNGPMINATHPEQIEVLDK